jgi:hypothetical protein
MVLQYLQQLQYCKKIPVTKRYLSIGTNTANIAVACFLYLQFEEI